MATYKQAQAWRLLDERPRTAAELAKELGLTIKAACCLRRRMEQAGLISSDHRGRGAVLHVIRAFPPMDLRGYHDGAMIGLSAGWAAKRGNSTNSYTSPSHAVVQERREGTPGAVPSVPSLASLLGA